MIEAKCPICNSICEVTEEYRYLDGPPVKDLLRVIKCPACGIQKEYLGNEFYGQKIYTKEEAIADWNNLAIKELDLLNKIKETYKKCGNDELGFWEECGYLITGEY